MLSIKRILTGGRLVTSFVVKDARECVAFARLSVYRPSTRVLDMYS